MTSVPTCPLTILHLGPRRSSHCSYDWWFKAPNVDLLAAEMLSGSQHFTISGKTFINITKNYGASRRYNRGGMSRGPSGVRMIRLEDIDLLSQLNLHNDSGVVGRQQERRGVRRVYSAKIVGRTTNMTMAIYQGDGAEEEWRQHIATYMSICGAANANKMHATIFHVDLILFCHFLDHDIHSSLLIVYAYAYCITELRVRKLSPVIQSADTSQEIQVNFDSIFQQSLYDDHCTFWIRRSTGQLCMDLVPDDNPMILSSLSNSQVLKPLTALTQDATVIDS
ncbi:hypothetical protein B0H19DRAFT_1068379 [Mycena capillaripes]|nr:hypothetical protein B0H19DRAFT_1068379 [Mycena capillaripes]